MAKLVVFGATGYAGGHIVDEALRRGNEVVAVARQMDDGTDRPGLTVRTGSVHDQELVRELAADADTLVVAVPARAQGDQPGLVDAVPGLAEAAAAGGARLGVVGGAGSLRVAEGGPRLMDTPDFPAEYLPEARAHGAVLAALHETPAELDWFYVSPSALFGAYAPGERTGSYRLGDDVLLTGPDGESTVGGADYAQAFVDEIVDPGHSRTRFTVGY